MGFYWTFVLLCCVCSSFLVRSCHYLLLLVCVCVVGSALRPLSAGLWSDRNPVLVLARCFSVGRALTLPLVICVPVLCARAASVVVLPILGVAIIQFNSPDPGSVRR